MWAQQSNQHFSKVLLQRLVCSRRWKSRGRKTLVCLQCLEHPTVPDGKRTWRRWSNLLTCTTCIALIFLPPSSFPRWRSFRGNILKMWMTLKLFHDQRLSEHIYCQGSKSKWSFEEVFQLFMLPAAFSPANSWIFPTHKASLTPVSIEVDETCLGCVGIVHQLTQHPLLLIYKMLLQQFDHFLLDTTVQ